MSTSLAKKIAYCAIMTALLIGGQVALGFVAGIEVVTVLLVCFAYVFGVWCGVITAIAFSLLRCFIWGFYPAVILLYLIYYPLLALLFGLIGRGDKARTGKAYIATINVAFVLLGVVSMACAKFSLIKISVLFKNDLNVLLWVLGGICFALAVLYDALLICKAKNVTKIFFVTAIATVCTICFTLLDDVISPLFLGLGKRGTLAYFYASFTAMLPQTICTIATVSTMFYPLTTIMKKFNK